MLPQGGFRVGPYAGSNASITGIGAAGHSEFQGDIYVGRDARVGRDLRVGVGGNGSGVGVFALGDAATAPPNTPSGGGVLYSEGGALKWKGSSGTVTVIAPA